VIVSRINMLGIWELGMSPGFEECPLVATFLLASRKKRARVGSAISIILLAGFCGALCCYLLEQLDSLLRFHPQKILFVSDVLFVSCFTGSVSDKNASDSTKSC